MICHAYYINFRHDLILITIMIYKPNFKEKLWKIMFWKVICTQKSIIENIFLYLDIYYVCIYTLTLYIIYFHFLSFLLNKRTYATSKCIRWSWRSRQSIGWRCCSTRSCLLSNIFLAGILLLESTPGINLPMGISYQKQFADTESCSYCQTNSWQVFYC